MGDSRREAAAEAMVAEQVKGLVDNLNGKWEGVTLENVTKGEFTITFAGPDISAEGRDAILNQITDEFEKLPLTCNNLWELSAEGDVIGTQGYKEVYTVHDITPS